MSEYLKPKNINLDASTICQLRCPGCASTAKDQTEVRVIGGGFLKIEDFRRIINDSPWIRNVDLSCRGEIFLNPDLLFIIKYADKKRVLLRADTGANLNFIEEEVAEAMVKYKFRSLTCSIDGANNDTYSIYRVGGDIDKVISNINRINYYKKKYKSIFPLLRWKFITFGHNVREIGAARKSADKLNMVFVTAPASKESEFSISINDRDNARKYSDTGIISAEDYLCKYNKLYFYPNCRCLWDYPLISWDGRVLGCCANIYSDFGNAFKEDLSGILNSERINYARRMISGEAAAREDIPCSHCWIYQARRELNHWVSKEELRRKKSSFVYFFKNFKT